jgi:hypothetical protein
MRTLASADRWRGLRASYGSAESDNGIAGSLELRFDQKN